MSDDAPKCLWCDEPGEYLCDQLIGRDRETVSDSGEQAPSARETRRRKAWGHRWPEGRPPGTLTSLSDDFFTCDASMCDAHRQQVGHLCKRGPGSSCESIDMCHFHWGFGDAQTHRLLSKTEAESYRKRLRMAVENGLRGAESDDFYG